jgi:hypothetical protein
METRTSSGIATKHANPLLSIANASLSKSLSTFNLIVMTVIPKLIYIMKKSLITMSLNLKIQKHLMNHSLPLPTLIDLQS